MSLQTDVLPDCVIIFFPSIKNDQLNEGQCCMARDRWVGESPTATFGVKGKRATKKQSVFYKCSLFGKLSLDSSWPRLKSQVLKF